MRLALAIAALACMLGALASRAEAGVYEVRSCGANSASAYALTNPSPGTMTTAVQCPPSAGALLAGLFAAPTTGTFTSDAAWSGWTISTPPGLTLRRLDVHRSLGTRRDFWKAVVRTADGAELESCALGDLVVCQHGDPGGDTSAAYVGLNTRGVTFAIECHTAPTGLTCPGRTLPQAWVAIYSSVALVDDPAPPVLEPLSGALVAPGWHSGVEAVSVDATDVSGIKRLSLIADETTLYDQPQTCDMSRMQPCPPSKREAVTVDTSRLPDGTHELQAVATDAADQAGTATAVLKVDQHAPDKPTGLSVERNPDGTVALAWANPDQGTAAPIVAARYEICDAAASNCVAGETVSGRDVARVQSLVIPAGEHVVRVWLLDEAGNVDPASAAVISVDPSTISARRAVDMNPPVLLPDGPAPSARLRITRARRTGSTLTLSGTVARAATATITAEASRAKTSKPAAKARTKPRRGKWSVRVKLTPALRTASSMYLSVTYAGQQSFRKTTLHRRLSKKPLRRGSTATEFSVESGSAPRH
jgi:hypothetical protein